MPDYIWESTYQCQAVNQGGGAVKVDLIQLVTDLPLFQKEARAWDLASSQSTAADETVGARGGKDENGDFYLIDVVHGRWEPGTRDQTIVSQAAFDGTTVSIRLPRDPAEAGERTEASLTPMLDGYSFVFKRPLLSKQDRAQPMASAVQRGKFKMLVAPWNEHVLEQLRKFPLGEHDDIVDAIADCYAEVMLSSNSMFDFRRDVHVYASDWFQDIFGGGLEEIDLLQDEELFTRWAGYRFATASNEGSWMYLLAKDAFGAIYVYDEIQMMGCRLEDQADILKGRFKAWQWDGHSPIFSDPRLKGADSDGLSRWTKFSRLGIPMYSAKDDPVEGWSMIDSLLAIVGGQPKLRVHERCKHLIAYLSTTPRDQKHSEDIDQKWIGAGSLNALRFALHSRVRGPENKSVVESLEWQSTVKAA
jgi:predicted phage terminase large subunit-like protein